MPDHRDELDHLLDSALARYADPGPDSGLEKRILSRIAAEAEPTPRRRWLPWAVALPAAICLLLLIHPGRKATAPGTRRPNQAAQLHNPAVPTARRSSSPAVQPETVRQTKPLARHPSPAVQPETVRQTKPLARHPRLAAAAAPQPLPKLDVFPTPQPLTPQERALAAYVAHLPLPEQQALARSEREPIPRTITSIPVMPDAAIPMMADADIPVLHFEPPDEGAN